MSNRVILQNKIKKTIALLKQNRYIFLLVLITFICHFNWFSFNKIINFGDQLYLHETTLKEFLSSVTWLTQFSLGKPNVQIFTYPIFFVSSILANFHFTSASIFNFTYLIPIAVLGFVAPYFLSRKLTNNTLIAFIVALFYGSTIDFLVRQNAHANIAFYISIAPLILLSFMVTLEKNKSKNWLLFIFLFSLGIFYEVRLSYVIKYLIKSDLVF